jgi:hypothetical protein
MCSEHVPGCGNMSGGCGLAVHPWWRVLPSNTFVISPTPYNPIAGTGRMFYAPRGPASPLTLLPFVEQNPNAAELQAVPYHTATRSLQAPGTLLRCTPHTTDSKRHSVSTNHTDFPTSDEVPMGQLSPPVAHDAVPCPARPRLTSNFSTSQAPGTQQIHRQSSC